jgi:hypothetical protein
MKPVKSPNGRDGTPNSVSARWGRIPQLLADAVIGAPSSDFSLSTFQISAFPPVRCRHA